MEQNRGKLETRISRIPAKLSGITNRQYPHQYSFTNIRTENASNIRLRSVGRNLNFNWQQSITFNMDAEFTVCTLVGRDPMYKRVVTTNDLCNHPVKVTARPTVTVASANITKPWRAADKKIGEVEHHVTNKDIKLNVIKADGSWKIWESRMIGSVWLAPSSFMESLRVELDDWLDKDVKLQTCLRL